MAAKDTAQFEALLNRNGSKQLARDCINIAMIRHWCDAFGDTNPIYLDEKKAVASGWPNIVAPPAMLNSWTMPGNISFNHFSSDEPFVQCIKLCDEEGLTGVVATNCNHHYLRYLNLDEQLHGIQRVDQVSAIKKTFLGKGRFITTSTDFYVGADKVGTMLFRILKYFPKESNKQTVPDQAIYKRRPHPAINQDTAFFWDGLKQKELRIQQCTQCQKLQHPPVVRCPSCGSYELSHIVACGKAHLYSFVEPQKPVMPFMQYPYAVGLVELAEGTRLICNIVDCPPAQLKIGMPLQLDIQWVDETLALPMFKPQKPKRYWHAFKRRQKPLYFEEVDLQEPLPKWELPITPRLIVAGAIASQDYQNVHHDRDGAIAQGAKDIFTNIMTTQGLCARYINDWAGSTARFISMETQLGAPNYPQDTLIVNAFVAAMQKNNAGNGQITIQLKGENKIGDHVNARVVIELPSKKK